MKKLVPAVGLLAIAASRVSGQLVYEPFDYGTNSIGTNLAHTSTAPAGGTDPFNGYTNPMTGTQWFDTNTSAAGNTTPTEVQIVGGNLTPTFVSGLQPATGNMTQFNANSVASRSARLAIAPTAVTSGTVYYSLRFKITDSTNMQVGGAGTYFAGLNDSVGTQTSNPSVVGARLHVRLNADQTNFPGQFQVGIKSASGNAVAGANYDYAPANFTSGANGDTVFVVGAYRINPGTGIDENLLWVNPSASLLGAGIAPAPVVDVLNDQSSNDFNPSSFILRQGNLLIPTGMQVDEVRVDTSWAGVTAPAGTTWQGTSGGSYNSAGNWSGGAVPNGPDGNGVPRFVNFNSVGAGNVNLTAPVTVGTVNLRSTTGYTIAGSAITLDGTSGGQGNINVYAITDPTTGAIQNSAHTIGSDISMATASAANIAMGQTLSLTGVISGGTSLTKNGGGALVLTNNNNNFSGGLNIGNGMVVVTSDGNLGASGGGVTLSRGTLRLDSAMTVAANRTITIAGPASTEKVGTIDTNGKNSTIAGVITGASVTKEGTGTLELSGANTYVGTFVRGGTLAISNEANLGALPATASQNINFQNGGSIKLLTQFNPSSNRIVNLMSGGGGWDTNGFNVTYGGRISGAGQFQKRGAGTLTLTATNSDYQGTTNIFGGVLETGQSSSIGNDKAGNDLQLNGGTFRATATIASVNRGIILSGAGGTIDTNGNNLTFGAITSTVGGAVTGSGSLTKMGAGELRVEKLSTTGGLTVGGGKLTVTKRSGAGAKIVRMNTLSINSGAALDLNDNHLVVDHGNFQHIIAKRWEGYRDAPDAGATGIISSAGQTITGAPILALFDNSIAGFPDFPFTNGVAVPPTAVLGQFSYLGDADLNGQVTPDDYGAIDSNLGAHVGTAEETGGMNWFAGDWNFDGDITPDDYGAVDANLGNGQTQGPQLGATGIAANGLAAVPEPASLGSLGVAAVGLIGRRRRKA
ncbi:MAG TPA: autotransporter-associated beta strand repeat-containing protein [Tepidisphaeraceae bacterium]|jgi:autotransporter-associated beta strand protein